MSISDVRVVRSPILATYPLCISENLECKRRFLTVPAFIPRKSLLLKWLGAKYPAGLVFREILLPL